MSRNPRRLVPPCLTLVFVLLSLPALALQERSLVCDLEQDGSLERVRLRWDENHLRLSLESGEVLAELDGLSPDAEPRFADANGDGLTDLVDGETLLLDGRRWLPQAERSILEFHEKWNTAGALNNVWDSEVDDLDGDGAPEIVGQAYYYPGTLVRVFENDDNDSFTEVWASAEQSTPSIVALGKGDTDGDGQTEILAGVAGTLGTLYMWENVGDDLYEVRGLGFQMDWQVRDLHVGDTDEDGAMEIIGVGSSSTDGGSLKIFEHSGAVGQNLYTNVYEYETVSYLLGCEIGDADNDGNMEALLNVGGWAGFPTYIRRIEYDPGSGTWEHKLFEASTTGLPISAEIADIDGDGDNELVIGSTEVIHIYESYADDSFTPVWSSDFGIQGNLMDLAIGPDIFAGYPAVASCSFDGQVDLLSFEGEDYLLLLEPPLFLGEPLRSIDMGFFDGGDPLADMVLARSASARISMFEMYVSSGVDWPADAGSGPRLTVSDNPFSGSTEIFLSGGPDRPGAKLRIYDAGGRLVREFAGTAGSERFVWDGRDQSGAALPSGVYLLRLFDGGASVSSSVVLLR